MIAAQRSGVTLALHILEGTGMIRSARGLVTIRDREKLEALAGDSYGLPEVTYRRLIGPLGWAIAVEAGLSFLGVGIQPPTPSWGVILADGFDYIEQSPWPVVFASVTLMLTTLGFTLLGEAMRDTLDPRVAGLTRRARARGAAM